MKYFALFILGAQTSLIAYGIHQVLTGHPVGWVNIILNAAFGVAVLWQISRGKL